MASSSRFDLVVFGASGFTGQFVVDEVARVVDDNENKSLTWAVAGRTKQKLQNVLEESSKRTGKDIKDIEVIIADISRKDSLLEMCKKAKVILNCVGPYGLYGDVVVDACIKAGTHYLDITGEPNFIANTQLKYNTAARNAGVYVVNSCGWDSIPADMGLIYIQRHFKGDVNEVELFRQLHHGDAGMSINKGTYESAVNGFRLYSDTQKISKLIYPTPLPSSQHKQKQRQPIFYCKEVGQWCIRFLGCDESVVTRTQRYRYDELKQHPIQFSPYLCFPTLPITMLICLMGMIFGTLAYFSIGRKILSMYPEFFTYGIIKLDGPSAQQIKEATFVDTFFVRGYRTKSESLEHIHADIPNKRMEATITGPEPGYVATPIMLVQSAIALLQEKDKLPSDGGVYTPACVFADTDLIERLNNRGIVFRVL